MSALQVDGKCKDGTLLHKIRGKETEIQVQSLWEGGVYVKWTRPGS